MKTHLERRGYAAGFGLEEPVDVIVLIDPRPDLQNKAFGISEIAEYRRRHPEVRVLHRVNECDQRKGTDFMDRMLGEANRFADHTVFISEWLRDYHAERWFDRARPHSAIYNGADPRVFHPIGSRTWRPEDGPFRLVTHHWSANPLKGFDVYRQVDDLIAEGGLPGVELRVIGRWPDGTRWRAARTCAPTHGADLADRLRECHAYITASRWEPCGMHHVEGAQCGLPLLYHEDGGGIVEAGVRYGIGFRDDVGAAVESMRSRCAEYRLRVLGEMPSGERMCLEYGDIIQRLIAERA
jgi:glycosyltransferase involved in cell wall biosynthesis